jgi:hypothetical protein
MKPLVPLLLAVSLAACGGGEMSDNTAMNPPAAAAARINFTAFTEKLISTRSETGEPVAVAPTDFAFPDDDDEAAFAAVVPTA